MNQKKYNQNLNKLAKKMKEELQYSEKKGTLKDIKLLIECAFLTGKYEPMFTTKLYTKQGGEYCRYLQMICCNREKYNRILFND